MTKVKLSPVLFFVCLCCIYSTSFAQQDTLSLHEDQVIDEIVQSKHTTIGEDKVEYLSQVTKYGFKNLFRNYTYNPTVAYSQQINPYAENYMQSYLKTHTAYLQRLQKDGLPYFNLIEGILSQYGLPHELKYLAVIESDLKASALSVAGARGPWQFMDYTARGYGLRVDNTVDERTDYYKSTHAAAKYLLRLYRNYKDWLLVIAAYNGGPGVVDNAIRRSGSRNFWKLQYYLPEESRNHVKKFIATHFVMENGNGGNSGLYVSQSDPVIPDSLKSDLSSKMISGRYDAGILAQQIGLDMKTFNTLNPKFNAVLATGSDFNLQLPKDKMLVFEEKKYDILNNSVEAMLQNAQTGSRTVYGKK